MAGFVANAGVEIAAPPESVWAALTDPEQIAIYMQGSRVNTTWEVGSPIGRECSTASRPASKRDRSEGKE